jgi:hypothetical protein
VKKSSGTADAVYKNTDNFIDYFEHSYSNSKDAAR